MKKSILLFSFILLTLTVALAQNKANSAIEKKVEELRQLLVAPDQQELFNITSEQLSYGHSNGKIENQQQFVDFLLSGKSQFVTIELLDQTIDVVGKTGIVRHTLVAETNNEGETVHIKLGVLLIWQKKGSGWKLLARQAFKM